MHGTLSAMFHGFRHKQYTLTIPDLQQVYIRQDSYKSLNAIVSLSDKTKTTTLQAQEHYWRFTFLSTVQAWSSGRSQDLLQPVVAVLLADAAQR